VDQIIPFDWHRMLWGDAPIWFMLEVAFRVLVIWLWTAVLLRWIGGRSIAQLSIVEFLLVIALGSAVGDAMFYPDVPLVHAMLVILLVVSFDKLIDVALRRWSGAKAVIDGRPVEVLRDGRILCDGLQARRLNVLELMELLRLKGVENLGSLRLAYLEPSGELSLFKADPPRPGLAIVPPVELSNLPAAQAGQTICCGSCGQISTNDTVPCPECGETAWTFAQMPRADVMGAS
jgi:uncharacterized membrane protein YcaP (DUF421 family)